MAAMKMHFIASSTEAAVTAAERLSERYGHVPLREAEVIGLITQGLTNEDIAARAHLSINSVKTYIRTSYRKMGVERRSQAVLWGVQHGFAPEAARRIG